MPPVMRTGFWSNWNRVACCTSAL